MRAYEKALASLRAYTITSAQPLRTLKKEIESERAKWIEAADEMARLLDEADSADALTNPGWGGRFRVQAEAAEERMLRMTDATIVDVAGLKSLAKDTHDGLVHAIREVRTSLRDEVSSYERIGRRKRRS